jgi:NhaP-type Na+/H+ or K+/H+ antiporter
MLESAIAVLLIGFIGSQIARRFGAPPLIGMIVVGIILGQEVANLLDPGVLAVADNLRIAAVMVILMRAGLGLDREKLQQQGSVALRLGILPAACEALVIAIAAMVIFKFDFLTGLLLGSVISAESPAVIVPGMLHLKRLGWGVTKGIPDVILTSSALSDVLILLVFSLLLNLLTQGIAENSIILLPLQVILQIGLGVVIGGAIAWLFQLTLAKLNLTQNPVQEVLIAATLALGLILLADIIPYSGYLGVMAMGFFLVQLDAPLGRRLRTEFNHLWIVAEIILFVLLGAQVQLSVLENVLLPGLGLLAIGLFLGRTLGWYLSTVGSNWSWRERIFLLPGNSAKATVQAAIGAIPLAVGVEGGEVILAIAALSILVTAPLGAWAIPTFAPKLLEKGEVDPTKINIAGQTRILAAVDTSPLATKVLTKTAELARRSDAKVIVLHVISHQNQANIDPLRQQVKRILADISHDLITTTGTIPTDILQTAQEYQVSEIVMGKRGHQPLPSIIIGSVSQAVLEKSSIPVLLVESEDSGVRR